MGVLYIFANFSVFTMYIITNKFVILIHFSLIYSYLYLNCIFSNAFFVNQSFFFSYLILSFLSYQYICVNLKSTSSVKSGFQFFTSHNIFVLLSNIVYIDFFILSTYNNKRHFFNCNIPTKYICDYNYTNAIMI